MLFNSYIFLLGFLPVFLLGFFWIRQANNPNDEESLFRAKVWLTAASLFFYAWWNPSFLIIFVASVLLNFVLGRVLCRSTRFKKPALLAGIILNMGMLGYFKYAVFFEQIVEGALGLAVTQRVLVLPLGISFFTFVQLAFLVDAYYDKVHDTGFLDYILFVCFFPHLIAGPIVHHDVLIRQFRDAKNFVLNHRNLAVGLLIFTVGLLKKTVLADRLEPYAAMLFDAERTTHYSALDAWLGALAYTFQLYFDFSGYSDMAIGLSKMLGIRLPMNFNSPYRSLSIVEFWRRWHMTLGEFLRDYVYIPLGGNRKGPRRRYINLFLTMLIGGLWHGAGYTYVIWGALHGFYLCVNHAWQARMAKRFTLSPLVAWSVTFVSVVFAWCFFRAPDLASAARVCAQMVNPSGGWHSQLYEGQKRYLASLLLLTGAISFFAPNAIQVLKDFDPVTISSKSLQGFAPPAKASGWNWRPRFTPLLGLAVGIGLIIVLVLISRPSKFIYYQF